MSVEKDLKKATDKWSLPLIARTYSPDKNGRKRMEEEAKILVKNGYEVGEQSSESGHTNKGRTAVRAAVVGGIAASTAGLGGFLFRPSKSKGELVITYRRRAR